ncbi:TPA: hypothetical protein I7149_20315 [Vibrio vulnificus]|nr:hypothetical protein [Vibrio vulnificus]
MTKLITYQKYESLFLELKSIISESHDRTIRKHPDELFIGNVNFFVKSYLINICTYLEAMLQDLAFLHAKEINLRIVEANIPQNYVLWRNSSNVKEKDFKFKSANFSVTKKDISDNLSASPYRTLKLFEKLGVDLTQCETFEANRELVTAIVSKRNNIIHHNDKAADVSYDDLILFIDVILSYSKAILLALNDEA